MPSKLEQTLQMPGGRANLLVAGVAAADRATLELAITKPDTTGTTRYLNPSKPNDPWSTATHWLKPSLASDASDLVFELDGDVTVHLLPYAPYELLLRDGGGMRHVDRFTGIALRGTSSASAPIAAPAKPVPPPPPLPSVEEPRPLIAEPVVPLPPPPPSPPKSRWLLWAAIALAALLLAGGAGWYFFTRDGSPDGSAPIAEAPVTLDEARRVLTTDPQPADALARAQAHAAKGELQGAFLLYRYAAEKGDMTASVALAAMYDPATHSAQTSPLPAANPAEAARWYEPAAQAGQAEAQYRLGMLLKSGATADTDGPEKGVSWLRKAADQGYGPAQEELKK
ncbi:MAG: tetratricopeptide repeat protein [Alphaproteobacteria bacterium]